VSLHEIKHKFLRSFNSVYHKCSRSNPEIVVLQLVNSYCKPHLLCAVESTELSHTTIKQLLAALVWEAV